MTTDESQNIPMAPVLSVSRENLVRAFGTVVVLAVGIWTALISEQPTGETLGRAVAPVVFGAIVAASVALVRRKWTTTGIVRIFPIVAVAASFLASLSNLEQSRPENRRPPQTE